MKAIHKFRRALCVALCLALLPLSALAAQGDATILRRDDPGFLDNIEGVTALGDTLYLQGERALYTYRAGDAAPAAYAWDVDLSDYSEGGDWEVGKLTVAGSDGLRLLLHLSDSSGGGREYTRTLMGKLTLSEGSATVSELREVPWPEGMISHYGSGSYVNGSVSHFCIGSELYLLNYGDRGYEVYAAGLDDMEWKRLPLEDVQMIAPYADGRILAASGENRQSCALSVYDPASEGVTQLCALDPADFGNSIVDVDSILDGLACDLQTGECYCICNGELRAIDLETGELGASLADIPVSGSTQNGYVLDGGYYAYQSYLATLVRNLSADAAPETRLKLYDSSYMSSISGACFDFAAAHPEASVSVTRDYGEQENLLQNMLSQDDRIDVYILSAASGAYSALCDRGYMAELDSDALQGLVDRMYPGVQSAAIREGRLVALPVQAYCWSIGVSEAALERIGLTMEDIPGNWPDFLDFLAELPQYLEGTDVLAFDPGFDQGQMRSQLLFMILEAYQNYAAYALDAPAYDAPMLRAILEKLERVDFAALGLAESEAAEETISLISTSGGYASESELLSVGIGATFRELPQGMQPLLLAMDAESPALLTLDVSVAFVNPYSKNIPLATQFLEALAAKLPEQTLYNFIPSLTEPMEGKNYAMELARYQENVDALRRELEAAEAIDRAAIEAELQEAEAALADYAANGMAVSREKIDWFRSHDDCVTVSAENWLYSDDTGEALDLVQQYLSGRINLSRLLSGIDRKIQMMTREGA